MATRIAASRSRATRTTVETAAIPSAGSHVRDPSPALFRHQPQRRPAAPNELGGGWIALVRRGLVQQARDGGLHDLDSTDTPISLAAGTVSPPWTATRVDRCKSPL